MATVLADLSALKAKTAAVTAYVSANYKQLGAAVVAGKFSSTIIGLAGSAGAALLKLVH